MNPKNFPRGSEWRKWDLQVHTPFSALNNGFGSDFEAYAKSIIEKASADNIAAIGVTDYFSIEGYSMLRKLLSDEARLNALGTNLADQAKQILFIPNIEFRTSIIVRDLKGADSRVNFHVLFSDDVTVEDIDEHFLRELKFTAEANPDGRDEKWPVTIRNLEALGKRLKQQHHPFQKDSDLFVGMMNAVVDHSQISDILEGKPSIFRDRYLLCLPCDEDLSKCSWNGQGHLARKLLIQKSHLLLSSNEGTRLFALGRKHTSPEEYKTEFKTLKPCIHSSDSHTLAEAFRPDKDRHTWIKSDPTFDGLRQILNEPSERVHIGDTPATLVRLEKRPTKIIDSIEIRKIPGTKLSEKWFDVALPLNSELVAIIGNKGSGKSALSDIIGLLGNTPRSDSFSFLNADKFRKSKNSKSKQFSASLKWADGSSEPAVTLDLNPSKDAVEKVKYIPQSYLEDICNELGEGKGGRFYRELQKVIFSHVPIADRLGFESLDDLLESRTEETRQAIIQLIALLRLLNSQIASAEHKLLPQHRETIDAQLAEKTRELTAHLSSPPTEIQQPDTDPVAVQENQQVLGEIETENQLLTAIDAELANLKIEESTVAMRRSVGEKLQGKIRNLERTWETFLAEAESEFADIDISVADIVSFEVRMAPIETALATLTARRDEIAKRLDSEEPTSLAAQRSAIVEKIENLRAKLSAREREYQLYLDARKNWQETGDRIQGNEDSPGSVQYLRKQLDNLDEVPKELERLRRTRIRRVLEIFREKQKLRSYYERYYGAVQNFLERHPLAADDHFRLTFNVSMNESGFSESFLGRLNRRKIGPFMGDQEGSSEMKSLLDEANFESARGVVRFVEGLFDMMTLSAGRQLMLIDQLRQGVSIEEVYNYVYALDFLNPIYSLRWDGKDLEQLSPGERGNLLLIFYLLIDRDDIPLVIDQPEENLDNQTVFKTLVPCIKDAKSRRQIVMVTHNPNLAVVCDAEQIICAEMQKNQHNSVEYISGSIENETINRRIVDVLEGTRPAFDNRDDKYLPITRT